MLIGCVEWVCYVGGVGVLLDALRRGIEWVY